LAAGLVASGRRKAACVSLLTNRAAWPASLSFAALPSEADASRRARRSASVWGGGGV
jgi:hypothetical protein